MDDGEWCTVLPKGNNNHTHFQSEPKSKPRSGKPRPLSSRGGCKPKSTTAGGVTSSIRKSSATGRRSGTGYSNSAKYKERSKDNCHERENDNDDDDDDEEEEDDDSDSQEEQVLPPYHTAVVVLCPMDNCSANEPFLDTTALVKHLRTEHKIVFKDLHHMYIALDPYLMRWAQELRSKPIEEYGRTDDTNEHVYVIDPRHCPLDKEIRDEMQRAKLDEVLKTQQRERDQDAKVPRKCLFCKVICDNRTVLFKHMFSEHNFNIGLPDNLVNVNEFLDLLENKLTKLQCLYCEKTFTSAPVLRKHMRKKKHFKIAPKNRQYDRFYVINYLEPGKNWEHFEHDNYESDDDKRDDDWADWSEEEPEPTMCLFDSDVFPSPAEALEHIKSAHGFNLSAIRKEHNLDFYKTVVLLNYIRHQSSLDKCFVCGSAVDDLSLLPKHLEEKECLKKPLKEDADFWKDPKYLLPTYENDPILTGFEVDEEEEDAEDVPDVVMGEVTGKK
ncbi:hypothetical protein BX666DRAFT_2020339 [Dichotomocladium elegans]|nr:hypothetical protein BX666DRAFT_2020339 [Dichotomocladium elegans]